MDGGSIQDLSVSYWGKEARAHEEEVMRALENNAPLFGLYLITLAQNPLEQLDILSSVVLVQPAVQRRLPPVVGVAFGREEAFELVEDMARDAFKATGTVDFRAFFNDGNGGAR